MTLTREEIMAMEPGRELDALIAEQVMGWKNTGTGVSLAYGAVMTMHTDQTGTYRRVPNYSTDISAAWEVADKLKIAIIPQSSSAPENLKYLARAEWDFRQKEIDVFAATAPEAICKAALLAVLNL